MSFVLLLIVVASLLGLAVGVGYVDLAKQPRRYRATVVLLVAALGVFAFALRDSVESKGGIDETAPLVFCYLAMLLGMFAEYGYSQAEQGRTKLTFVLMDFLMPIFASPIVFIPLLTITADMAQGGAFTRSKLMVYLVAFQNGFFWKSFFEQRRKAAEDAWRAGLDKQRQAAA
jgi:hypothetical protein